MLRNMLIEVKARLLGCNTHLICGILQQVVFALEVCACFFYKLDHAFRKRQSSTIVFVQKARPLIADDSKHHNTPLCPSPDETTWVKIRNPQYSQMDGRYELFENRLIATA